MNRWRVVAILGFILLIILACNLPTTKKVVKQRYDFKGYRTIFSGKYSCHTTDKAILIIDEDGVATLSTTGPFIVDSINCTPDPSGFEDTYVIIGLVNENSTIEFTSCNDGGFNAKGTVGIYVTSMKGTVSCIYNRGDDSGKVKMTLQVEISY
jgi:hypothetical protein